MTKKYYVNSVIISEKIG